MDWIPVTQSPMPTGRPILVTNGRSVTLWSLDPHSRTRMAVGCFAGEYATDWHFSALEVSYWAEIPALYGKAIVVPPDAEVEVYEAITEVATNKWGRRVWTEEV